MDSEAYLLSRKKNERGTETENETSFSSWAQPEFFTYPSPPNSITTLLPFSDAASLCPCQHFACSLQNSTF